MTPAPIYLVDLLVCALIHHKEWAHELFTQDYLNHWRDEIGEAILETSWDFADGWQIRTMIVWQQISAIIRGFNVTCQFIVDNDLF